MKEITFVIGAGASSEYGLPVGDTLKANIVDALRQRSGGGNVADQELYYAMANFAQNDVESAGNLQLYIDATEHINHSLVLSPSIDNFINSHQGDHRVELVGKLGIAKCILDSEHKSALRLVRDKYRDPFDMPTKGKPKLDFNKFSETWMVSFFMLLNQDCPLPLLKAKLSKISLIIFNYDRCVEQFMFEAIKSFYRVDDSEAADALGCLEIYHPYGMIGLLPWQSGNHIPFGAESRTNELIKAVGNIKTFSESNTVSDQDTKSIRKLISCSKSLVFLGFGFIPLNMRLLKPASRSEGYPDNTVYATTYNISGFDKERISKELRSLSGSVKKPNMSDCKANDLFKEYTRGIRLQ